jgi:hypothetical protein
LVTNDSHEALQPLHKPPLHLSLDNSHGKSNHPRLSIIRIDLSLQWNVKFVRKFLFFFFFSIYRISFFFFFVLWSAGRESTVSHA